MMVRGAVIAALLSWSIVADGQDSSRTLRRRTTYEDLQMFSQVLNQIRTNHPDSLDTHELLMAAVRAMVRAADPHSYVIAAIRMDPAREEAFARGRLIPVPIAFNWIEGTAVVASVASGSSAARQDILPGDKLLTIDGTAVAAESPLELEVMLAGQKNSSVTLLFERRRSDGTRAQLTRVVKREKVGEETAVPAAFMYDSITGYVRITTFDNAKVDSDLHDALDKLQKGGMRQLVLDLRDNGGGLVGEAARIAGEFLPSGATVYTVSGRKPDVIDTARVKRSFWSREKRYPVVVLQNEGTASASELVAGALQDHDRALIYGRPSFGKSLMMRGFPLSDGSIIMLVVGTVRTPCGRAIQRDYRGLSHAEYLRRAVATRDTAGGPTCKTMTGRVVYGGGGIIPDVWTGESAMPAWLEGLRESGVVLTWAGSHAATIPQTTVEDFARTSSFGADAVGNLRSLAREKGIVVPETAEATAMLSRELALAVAHVKWGNTGGYRVEALLDPDVAAAVRLMPEAARLVR